MADEKSVMEIKKPDLQILLQEHTNLLRTLADERRNADRRVAEERDRARFNEEKIREQLGKRIAEMEAQIGVLLKLLADKQGTIDRLHEDLVEKRLLALESSRESTEAEPEDGEPNSGAVPTGSAIQIPMQSTDCLKCRTPVMPAQSGQHVIGPGRPV